MYFSRKLPFKKIRILGGILYKIENFMTKLSGKFSKNTIIFKIKISKIILTQNFTLIPMVKTVFNFSQYILSNMQKYPKNQVFRTYF